jgi:hypothetical protein
MALKKFVRQETAEEKHMFLPFYLASMGYKERVPNISHLSYMNLGILVQSSMGLSTRRTPT